MTVVLVSPPVQDLYFTPGRSSALGMYTVKVILEKAGATVFTVNCPLLKPEGSALPPLAETDHLKPFIIPGERGKLSFFTGYRHFGPSFSQCAAKIITFHPDLILISSFAYAYAENTAALIQALRAQQCTVLTGVGGGGASAFPEYFLGVQCADFVFSGEAERALPLVISRIRSGSADFTGIPNISFVKNGTVVHPAVLLYPESEDLEFVWSITGESSRTTYISTSLSRGCPKQCRFCSNFITHNRSFRTVSREKIRRGLSHFPKEKHVILNFEDDNLTFSPEYFFDLLELFKATVPDISFMAENGIDYSFLTGERVRKLAEYGFKQFNLSLGTLSQESAARERRPLSLEKYEEVIYTAAAYNVPVITYFICGLQEDTPETVVNTLLYLASLPTLAGLSPFYPVPGLYGFTDRNLFTQHPPSLCRGAAFYPWNKTLTTEEMVTAFRLARFVNLVKQRHHTTLEKELLHRIISTKTLHTFLRRNKKNVVSTVPGMNEEMVSLFFKNSVDTFKGL